MMGLILEGGHNECPLVLVIETLEICIIGFHFPFTLTRAIIQL